jgi:hypothetical protein
VGRELRLTGDAFSAKKEHTSGGSSTLVHVNVFLRSAGGCKQPAFTYICSRIVEPCAQRGPILSAYA